MNNAGYGSDSPQNQNYSGGSPKGPDGNKEKSSKSLGGAQGGNNKMFHSGNGAKPQTPGQSASEFGDGGGKFGAGGNNKMFHSGNGAAVQTPGQSASSNSGNNEWGVKGGKTKMFGPQTAGCATAGSSVK